MVFVDKQEIDMEIKTFDNIASILRNDLEAEIRKKSKLAIAASCFSIYAYQDLKKQLDSIDELRFIFTSPTFLGDKDKKEQREFYIPRLEREQNLYGTEFELKLRNKLNQKAISKECAEWIRKKVKFKSNITHRFMNGFINIDDKFTYTPINGFTTADLGAEKGNALLSYVNRLDTDNSKKYLNAFDELWHDQEQLVDVTDRVLEHIETVYAENAPEFVYMVILYNIFKEFLNDVSEDVLPNEATGFKNSQIWNKLYSFQKDAALAIIHKLEKFNGCILADSVGLGKTFTALSVIKYYENRNKSVLVLCPKKLQDNWQTFKHNYANNPVAKDRFNYDVLFHTDLSRETGHSGEIDLSRINWGNYDLLVIDESHNFRNGDLVTTDDDDLEHYNRYHQLMDKVIKSGVKTKVLMLSATPVNNRFTDLKNQLQLAYEGCEDDLNEKLNTKKPLSVIFNNAQRTFNNWSKLPAEERKTDNLLNMLEPDFFEVLDSVTIARSRKHIEKNYNMEELGQFPSRLPPINKRPALAVMPAIDVNYSDIFANIDMLNLCVYNPSAYIFPSKLQKYEHLYGKTDGRGITLKGREDGVKKLMAVNLLKRLESSWYSFKLTASKILANIEKQIEKIEKYHKNNQNVEVEGLYDIDEDADDVLSAGGRYSIDLKDIDTKKWLADLQSDQEVFHNLIDMISQITPESDHKLEVLEALIAEKIKNPINPGNKKVLIFTAWADTADYLYDQISKFAMKDFGLNTGMISGTTDGKTTLKVKRADFNTVLTLFSPVSKDRDKLNIDVDGELDILIGTDCISEGQNLQDCDYVVNYDVHWNPVRLVQRFGRIDRIGSNNKLIQMVNFWPDMELDEYINLENRVVTRMVGVAITSTGNNIIGHDSDLEYRKAQLDKLQHETPDLEDMDTGVNIMDLGLNEFRMDLVGYIKQNPNIEKAPHGLHAVVPATKELPSGSIFVLRSVNNAHKIDVQNRLHPFYMVYLSDDGNVVCNHLEAKKMLDILRKLCRDQNTPNKALCKVFNEATKDGFEMGYYSDMLSSAIQTIIKVKDESEIDSLFTSGGTSFLTNVINGLDDFELIAFVVVK